MTVDVKGSAPLWMKIKDLADGVTYNFRIRAKTLTYGPEVEANITTGPGEGGTFYCLVTSYPYHSLSHPCRHQPISFASPLKQLYCLTNSALIENLKE